MTAKPALLHVRESFTVPGEIPSREGLTEFKFVVRKPVEVAVCVTPAQKQFHAQWMSPISDALWSALDAGALNMHELSQHLEEELGNLCRPLEYAARRVSELVRVFLRLDRLGRLAISRPSEWSSDGQTWYRVPSRLSARTRASVRDGLEAHTANYLQTLLDEDFTPFLGFEHLSRARRDDHARSQCIDAAIAAELAIKECLMRLEPKLAALITEVPSPPLPKMYGALLKHYSGKPLTPASRVGKLAEKRNLLLHRIESASPDDGDESVYTAAEALHHLFTVLRPGDQRGAELLHPSREGRWMEVGVKEPGEPTLAQRTKSKSTSSG